MPSLPEVPVLSTQQSGSGPIRGWDESVRRPEDGKLVVENLNSSLLVETAGNSLVSPFSLFNLVQFPNLECPADTGSIFYQLLLSVLRDPVSDRICNRDPGLEGQIWPQKENNPKKI